MEEKRIDYASINGLERENDKKELPELHLATSMKEHQ
jgi:hypothetical protein